MGPRERRVNNGDPAPGVVGDAGDDASADRVEVDVAHAYRAVAPALDDGRDKPAAPDAAGVGHGIWREERLIPR